MSSEKSLRTFFTKTQRSASPQEHKHLQALGHLNRALASAQDLDKKDRVKTPEDASPEDPDKLLPTESYESMDDKFHKAHKFHYPAVFKPSPQTDARSYRELHKRSFTARHLSKVGNTFQANLRPSDISQETEIGGGYTLNKKNRASYDEPVISMIDALMRVHLLLLSFVRVSFIKTWTNALGKTELWFTLDDMHVHFSYLWQKATEKKITSVEDFMKRELELRVTALGHMMGPEKLSLAKALNKARQECGDLWMNFQTPLTDGTSPLAANPMKRDLDDQQSGANKKLKTTGVQRASNSQETYGNGEAAPLKNGNRAGPGRVTLPDGSPATLCSRFRDGRGCSQWPCGGIHACDILIKKENYRPCLGKHSRANCPHNK